MTTIAQALVGAQVSGLARLDSQLLLLHALGRPAAQSAAGRVWLLAHDDDALPEAARARFDDLVRRRLDGEPVAYLTGHKEFHGLDLTVDRRVLVPRPETELLVAWALEVLHDAGAPATALLDLGTGSGAVALAIKHARPDLAVDAVDASADALAVARDNARSLGLEVRFLHGCWLAPVTSRYRCIVSNPPYVAARDPHLAALRHEPVAALVSGDDGLKDIRVIVPAAIAHLRRGGWLLLEHGHAQAAAVRDIFAAAGYGQIASRRDLAGHERCTGGVVIGGGPAAMVK